MKRIGILMLTLAMLLSLAACGAKDTQTIKAEEKQGTEQTASGTAANENQPAADLQKPEDKTTTPDAAANDDKQEEAKTDDTKKDEQKPATSKKDDVKQDEQKPADTAKDTTPESKSETPGYGNGSLTTSQVKEMQRWYGVSADGQWGAGSAKAAGGRTADEAWVYYQSNKQITTPETPSGGNTGNTGNTGKTGSTGSTGGGSTTPTVPTPATNIDWNAVIAAGNAYGKSVGFDLSHPEECRSFSPPAIFENEALLYKYPPTQDSAINVMKAMIDDTKAALVKANGFTHMDEGVIGADGQPFASGIKCAVEVDSDGFHVLYVWYF